MPEKSTILFLLGDLRVGGKERQLMEFIKAFPGDRYNCHLLVKSYSAYFLDDVKEKLDSFKSFDEKHFKATDVFKVKKAIEKVKPHVICSFSTTMAHFCLFIKVLFFKHFKLVNCTIRDAPIILNLHFKIERFLYSFYPIVVANSRAGLRAYGQDKRKGRYILDNCFDIKRVPRLTREEAAGKLDLPLDKFIVSMVAVISNRKDHKTFIQGASSCATRYSDFLFLVVGDGGEKGELEQYACELGLGESMKFLGSRPDVETIFLASHLSVLTSAHWHGEGVSNSIIESLACYTPVIATDNGGTREVIEDGVNGYVIKNGDYVDLADKICQLKTNNEKLTLMGQQGRTLVEKRFSVQTTLNTLLNIIEG